MFYVNLVPPAAPSEGEFVHTPQFWAEVALDSVWVPVDCQRGKVDERFAFGLSNQYVFGIDNSFSLLTAAGYIVDVTPRYTTQFYARLKQGRFPKVDKIVALLNLQFAARKNLHPAAAHDYQQLYQNEQHTFSKYLESEMMPSSLTGFRNHPR